MKTTSCYWPTFLLKAVLVFMVATFGLAGISRCDAQSIVGKWKGLSAQFYYSATYAKERGKTMEEKTAKETGNSEIEFKPDQTLITLFTGPHDPQVTTMKGTWGVAGDQLKLTLEPQYNPRKMTTTATISVNGNTMVTTALFPAPARTIKIISISKRM